MTKQLVKAPRHLAIEADPIRGPGRPPDLREDLETSFERLAETADFLFNRTTARFLTCHFPRLDELARGRGAQEASARLSSFLGRWRIPPGTRLLFRGDLGIFPPEVLSAAKQPGAETHPEGVKTIIWLLNYSGREEILQAVRRAAEAARRGEDIPALESLLLTAGVPDPDLLILTGGQVFLPDLLLYQISYSELHFSPKPWSQFTAGDLQAALEDFERRDRRYGRI